MTGLKLGDRVAYANGLERGYGVSGDDLRRNYDRKEWHTVKRRKHDDNYLLEGEGVVVGMRTYSNGRRYWDEDGATYTPDETFRVVLVAFSLFRNPAAVRVEDVTLLDEEFGEDVGDDCAACDGLLSSCSPVAACCADCTHGANWANRAEPLDGLDIEGVGQ
jgi:hypothetical protein